MGRGEHVCLLAGLLGNGRVDVLHQFRMRRCHAAVCCEFRIAADVPSQDVVQVRSMDDVMLAPYHTLEEGAAAMNKIVVPQATGASAQFMADQGVTRRGSGVAYWREPGAEGRVVSQQVRPRRTQVVFLGRSSAGC